MSGKSDFMNCPLCHSSDCPPFFRDRRRDYLRCGVCRLVFVPADQYLSAEEERAEYDLHENEIDDSGYRRFLTRVFEPVRGRVSPPARGLDFGCGPGPALAAMFREAGYRMSVFDVFYASDRSVLVPGAFDFVTATEVFEHLHRPGEEIERMLTLLRPGGWLGVMTKRVIDREAFAGWHYKNDLTHVCFFSEATFEWIAERFGLHLEVGGKDVVLMQKPGQ